jgi:hypothetical protein
MKRIENIFVSFEQSEKLKELGFDEETSAYYSTLHGKKELKNLSYFGRWNTGTGSGAMTAAPTVAQALKWFSREKSLYGYCDKNTTGWCLKIYKPDNSIKGCSIDYYDKERLESHDTDAAQSALLDKLLNILELEKEQ